MSSSRYMSLQQILDSDIDTIKEYYPIQDIKEKNVDVSCFRAFSLGTTKMGLFYCDKKEDEVSEEVMMRWRNRVDCLSKIKVAVKHLGFTEEEKRLLFAYLVGKNEEIDSNILEGYVPLHQNRIRALTLSRDEGKKLAVVGRVVRVLPEVNIPDEELVNFCRNIYIIQTICQKDKNDNWIVNFRCKNIGWDLFGELNSLRNKECISLPTKDVFKSNEKYRKEFEDMKEYYLSHTPDTKINYDIYHPDDVYDVEDEDEESDFSPFHADSEVSAVEKRIFEFAPYPSDTEWITLNSRIKQLISIFDKEILKRGIQIPGNTLLDVVFYSFDLSCVSAYLMGSSSYPEILHLNEMSHSDVSQDQRDEINERRKEIHLHNNFGECSNPISLQKNLYCLNNLLTLTPTPEELENIYSSFSNENILINGGRTLMKLSSNSVVFISLLIFSSGEVSKFFYLVISAFISMENTINFVNLECIDLDER